MARSDGEEPPNMDPDGCTSETISERSEVSDKTDISCIMNGNGSHLTGQGGPGASDASRLGLQDRHKFGEASHPDLMRIVVGEVMPRLLMIERSTRDDFEAGRDLNEKSPPPAPPTPTELHERATRFAHLLAHGDQEAAQHLIDATLAQGLPESMIVSEVLAPAARLLGRMWEEDEADFVTVTIGLGVLQQRLLEICQRRGVFDFAADAPRRVLISPAPHEQHTFGALLVAALFRDCGWSVSARQSQPSRQALEQQVSQHPFEVACLSVHASRHLDQVGPLLASLRGQSANPNLVIVVGGAAFDNNPSQAEAIGADAFARDAQDAVRQAEQLVASARQV